MNEKKTKINIKKILMNRGVIAALLILLIFISALFLTCSASYSVLIKSRESKFYKAKSIFIMGDTLICRKDEASYKSRRKALNTPAVDYSLSLVSMGSVAFIELIHDEDEDDEDIDKVPAKYLGSYKNVAAAHRGYLYLWSKKGRVYGSIKFPHWAKGVVEPLKWVKIKDGNISFIRSVSNRKELIRVGSSSYFTQRYYGRYNKSGSFIKGHYLKDGPKGLWEANKIK